MQDSYNSTLYIKYISVCSLKTNPQNPRKHSDQQIQLLAKSIKTVGFNVPVLVDGNLNIIAGHGRIAAAQLLNMQEVPTIQLDHLNKAQVQALMIADNRLSELAEWNDQLLAEQLKILSEADLDFNIEVTGFTVGEIDLRIKGLESAEAIAPADDLPPIPAGPPVTQPGDLWLLRKHRILCGNALDASSYRVLMEDKRAAMIFCDPPYNVAINGHAGGLGTIKHREFTMAAGEMNESEFISFLTRSCSLMARNSIDGAIHFVCMDWRHASELLEAGKLAYTDLKNVCVWAKDNAGMGSLYRSQYELIFVFKNGKVPHRNNVELGKHGRYRTNVWKYPGANTLSKHGEEGNLLALHPTVKPVALIADAILDVSARGDIVLDPFLGSGSTLIAAERVGRICYGMEIDPLYIDTGIRRWQVYTGDRAIHVATGRTFNEIAADREVSHVG